MNKATGADTAVKRTLKIGVIDIVIIVAVLALIATAIVRYTSDAGWFNRDTTRCNVAFTVTGVRYTLFDAFETDETVFLESGERLGTLSEASYTPAVFYATGADGGLIEVSYPENTLIDISGLLDGELVSANGGFITAQGVHIAPGSTLNVRTKTVDFTILITSVTIEETAITD